MTKYSTKITSKQINSKSLFVDTDYQRAVDPRRVSKIVKDYNALLVNPIKVSERSDGKFYVFDGQHTLFALKERNKGKDLMVDCKVYEFKGVNDQQRKEIEASLFADQNGISRAVQTNDKLRARYIAGDEDVINFRKLTEMSGFKMDFTSSSQKENIVCCAEAYRAYKKLMPSHYVEMLTVIKEAWGGDRDSMRAEIIGGMALLYENYANVLARKNLITKMSKVSPLTIIRNGNLSTDRGKAKYMYQIVKAYNKNLTTNRL